MKHTGMLLAVVLFGLGGQVHAADAVGNTSRVPAAAELAEMASPAEWKRGARYSGKGSLVDYRDAGLPTPSKHQIWVRDGESYLLVSSVTGVIASVLSR
ncbi:RcnB family protein [Paracoccus aurantiacus]|uniref:RcnB family protein n=1 Tax=Paracoccus aurantiacus TaxID=2599412 RepID=A0A5C6S172_9RHOB|nr:RcnB family protein [Paracoccus aurantiacus]TXB68597.1 RcnB family protein [Paracoccus aurantiacus]